jgi:hypothetical protein
MNDPVCTCTKLGPHMQAALWLSSSSCARFLALVLGSPPRFASMSSRNSAPLGSAVLPVYNALGGPQGKGHVTFDRTKSQYLDAGQRALNIATNGGLTIVAVVRFTGTAGVWERIIDLGSGANTNNLVLCRWSTNSHFNLVFQTSYQLNRPVDDFIANVIEQNTWMTVVVRYSASTRQYVVKVNNAADYTGTASATVPDRTVSGTYMGRSWWSGDAYFNGDMAGVFVVDEYLSTDATSAIADAMARGEDLTTQGPCAPQVLCPCSPLSSPQLTCALIPHSHSREREREREKYHGLNIVVSDQCR